MYLWEDEAERVEKIRQAVMRYRELLDLLTGHLADAERAYAALFDGIPAEVLAALPEKQRQGEAAKRALDDLDPLRRSVLDARFNMREIEKGFEELHDRVGEG